MYKSFLVVACFFLAVNMLSAQQFSFSKEIKFVHYLQNKDLLSDSWLVLKKVDSITLSKAQKDTLYFELGWLAYNQKKLDTAIRFLSQVSQADNRFFKSSFFASYCMTFMKQYDTASTHLLNIPIPSDSLYKELQQFQLAGIALLKKNYSAYNHYKKAFTYNNYALKQEETNLNTYANIIMKHKQKSPLLAGVLSAIVPGAGKWYAGKKKQAIGSLLPILSMGLLTLEAYNRNGIKDARFWIYGGLFSTFYIGNIWGSTVAIKIRNQDFNRLYENKILFDMHIPLRNIFN